MMAWWRASASSGRKRRACVFADAPEIVQPIPGSLHASGYPVGAEDREVGPQCPARKLDAVDLDEIVLQHVYVRGLCQPPSLLQGTIDVLAVGFVISGPTPWSVWQMFEQPLHAALGAGSKVAGDNEDVEPRALPRQLPLRRQF
jgi:hypothetical protein